MAENVQPRNTVERVDRTSIQDQFFKILDKHPIKTLGGFSILACLVMNSIWHNSTNPQDAGALIGMYDALVTPINALLHIFSSGKYSIASDGDGFIRNDQYTRAYKGGLYIGMVYPLFYIASLVSKPSEQQDTP